MPANLRFSYNLPQIFLLNYLNYCLKLASFISYYPFSSINDANLKRGVKTLPPKSDCTQKMAAFSTTRLLFGDAARRRPHRRVEFYKFLTIFTVIFAAVSAYSDMSKVWNSSYFVSALSLIARTTSAGTSFLAAT